MDVAISLQGMRWSQCQAEREAYILSRLINSFDNERALAILQNCRRAITQKSKLLLVERVLPDRVEHSFAA